MIQKISNAIIPFQNINIMKKTQISLAFITMVSIFCLTCYSREILTGLWVLIALILFSTILSFSLAIFFKGSYKTFFLKAFFHALFLTGMSYLIGYFGKTLLLL